MAERSPPPSCMRMIEPRNCGLIFMVFELIENELEKFRLEIFGLRSSQSSVSILLPMTVRPSCWMRTHGRSLIVGVGLFVDIVGRAEVERLHAEFAGEEAFGEFYLEVELIVARFR